MMPPPPPAQKLPPITREAIALICEAASDQSPLHLDDAFAQAAGYPSVVVPGTMLLGWVGQYLAEWAGDPARLRQWDIRFLAPVWPGEQIRLEGRVVPETAAAEVRASTSDGRLVGLASAVFSEGEQHG